MVSARRAHTARYVLCGALVCLGGCGGSGGGSSPPPPPPVSVSVSPGSASVLLGATQQFTATVTNASNVTVNWSVNGVAGGSAAAGTISPAGLYTAPQNLPTPATVTVTAASQADPARSASATATVQSDVAVTVTPDPASVELGAVQPFTAVVTGSGNPNRNVNWSVNGLAGGNATVGTITTTGVYAAPQNLPSPSAAVTITATSQADPSKSDAAAATVTSNFTIAVNGPASLNAGALAQFTHSITPQPGSNPNPAVTWSVAGPANTPWGVIDASGSYTAPTGFHPCPLPVTITATSVADTAKSGSLPASVLDVVSVTVSPAGPLGVPLEGTQPFSAAVSCTANQSVTWDVNGIPGGDMLTVGAISNPAPPTPSSPTTYFAPTNLPGPPNTVAVRATSQFDPSKTASVTVALLSNVEVTALTAQGSPTSTRAAGRDETLCATVTGTTNGTLLWTVNNVPNGDATVGTIAQGSARPCPGGAFDFTYTAPANVPASPRVTATVASQADPSQTASVTITIISAPLVTVAPATATLGLNGVQPFSSSVTGTANQLVTWSVDNVPNGDATVGQICVTGSSPCQAPAAPSATAVEYRAPSALPSAGSVTVTAISVDGASTGSAVVTLTTSPVPVVARLLPASVTAGAAGAFLLRVVGANFVAGSGAGASEILSGSPPVPRTTSCANPAPGVFECTATVTPAEVASPGALSIAIRNPDGTTSTPVPLVVAPHLTTEASIALTSGAPQAGGQDLEVVEPLTAGAGATALDINVVSVLVNSACSAGPHPVRLARPASGNAVYDICLGGTGLTVNETYTISGPPDIAIGPVQALGQGFVQVRITLTLTSATQTGARTIFVANANRDKAAASGALEVK